MRLALRTDTLGRGVPNKEEGGAAPAALMGVKGVLVDTARAGRRGTGDGAGMFV